MNVPDDHETQRVLPYYTAQIKMDPGNSINYVFRSACYEHFKKYQEALNDALMVSRLDPESWKGDHQVMKMHLKLGNLVEANEIASRYEDDESFDLLREKLKTKLSNKVRRSNNFAGSSRRTNTSTMIQGTSRDPYARPYSHPVEDEMIRRKGICDCCNIL